MRCMSLLCGLLFSSCATIINGPKETVSVSTTPSGATVTDGKETKISPAQFVLDRNRDYILTISKPGYDTENVKVVHVISGWVAGNIISFGWIGAGVDAASGAMWRLEPDTILVTLHPVFWYTPFLPPRLTQKTQGTTLKQLDSMKANNLISDNEYFAMKQLVTQAASIQLGIP